MHILQVLNHFLVDDALIWQDCRVALRLWCRWPCLLGNRWSRCLRNLPHKATLNLIDLRGRWLLQTASALSHLQDLVNRHLADLVRTQHHVWLHLRAPEHLVARLQRRFRFASTCLLDGARLTCRVVAG